MIVLNQIEYLKHLDYHPSGLVLHPQIKEMIENIHYLVNNNLPVNKYVALLSCRNYMKSCLSFSRQKSGNLIRAFRD